MKYSFNVKINNEGLAYAYKEELNVSYKDLGAVCDAVRYLKASSAVALTEKLARMEMPIPYKRHNKHMGARHELHGRKGKYPIKAAKEVRIVLLNAIANANNKALPGEELIVLHACANKTNIVRRQPSKGGISWGRGMYGRSALMHSDIEYSKIEIILGSSDEKGITKNMKYFIGKKSNISKKFESIERIAPVKKKQQKDNKKEKESTAIKSETKALNSPKSEKASKNEGTKTQENKKTITNKESNANEKAKSSTSQGVSSNIDNTVDLQKNKAVNE